MAWFRGRATEGTTARITVLAVGGFLIGAYFVLHDGIVRDAVFDATGLSAVAASVWGVRRYRPRPARPWWLLIAALLLLSAGDIVYDVLAHGFGTDAFPSLADVFYLASYPVLTAGVFGLLRARDGRRDTAAMLDALFAGLAFGVVVLVYFIEPSTRGDGAFLQELVSAAYPAMDVLLLVVLARLLFTSATRTPAVRLLAVAIAFQLVADLVYARLVLHDGYTVGGPVDAAFLASYLCRALAAVHPSMRRAVAPAVAPAPAARSRLGVVLAAALVLPVLAVTQALSGDPDQALVLSVASALGFVLLTARNGVVLAALRTAMDGNRKLLERERVLRSLGTVLAATPDRRGIYEAAVGHARELAGGGAETVLFVGHGRPRALAATGRLRPILGLEVDTSGVPEAVLDALSDGEVRIVTPMEGAMLRAALPEQLRQQPLLLVPLVAGGVVTGSVVVALAGDAAPDELTSAFHSLGSTVSLALEAAGLTEELVEQRSEERFGALMRNSSDIIGLVNTDLTVQSVTPSVTRVLGWDPAELAQTSILDLLHPNDLGAVMAVMSEALLKPGVYGPVACRGRHRDGSWRNLEGMGTSLLEDAAVNGIVLNIRDVSDRVRLEAELTHQAFHDPLTGLANRALFRDRVEHTLRAALRTGTPVEILFLDLDDFKAVNDGLGHRAGDTVLMAVAERLERCTRPGDTVARLGGDEFAVLVDDDGVSGTIVAQRIVDELQEPVVIDGQDVRVRASIGVATGPPGSAATDLLRDADLAMYVAKGQGKDRWVEFRPEMLDGFLGDLQLERDLRLALDRGDIDVHYQPVVNLATGAITGAEALVRWSHPERGNISPVTFIPVAERCGLIVPLGRHVLRRACRDVARWVEDRPDAGFTVSVNVSAGQLREPDLVDDIRAALADSGLSSNRLVVEVTESLLLENLEESVERLRFLRSLGVRVAIDDFGTGFSSLSYLGQLPVDILKIDKSFVDGVATGDDRNLVPAILELSRTLGLRTVAEGVETAEQADRLAELGCPLAQGFYFSRPVPAAEMERLLDARTSASPVCV